MKHVCLLFHALGLDGRGEVMVLVTLLCLSAALTGSEGRRRSREEEEEEALKRKQLQEEHLSKVSEIVYSWTVKILSPATSFVNLRCFRSCSEMLFSVVVWLPGSFSVPTTIPCSKSLRTLTPIFFYFLLLIILYFVFRIVANCSI